MDTLWRANYNPPLGIELECRIAGRVGLVVFCQDGFFGPRGSRPGSPQGFPIGGTGPNRITTDVWKRHCEVIVSRIGIAAD